MGVTGKLIVVHYPSRYPQYRRVMRGYPLLQNERKGPPRDYGKIIQSSSLQAIGELVGSS